MIDTAINLKIAAEKVGAKEEKPKEEAATE